MNFKESRTWQNLHKAFEGELKASSKYRIYAAKAREDGFEQIGNIFEETAHNEQEHGELWWKILHNNEMTSTSDNLKEAAQGEHAEWTHMYPEFAKIAAQEGYPEIAKLFKGVAQIEQHHDLRYKKLYENIKNDSVFCKPHAYVWICTNCGNLWYGECAPDHCPVCGYPQGYYELNCENY